MEDRRGESSRVSAACGRTSLTACSRAADSTTAVFDCAPLGWLAAPFDGAAAFLFGWRCGTGRPFSLSWGRPGVMVMPASRCQQSPTITSVAQLVHHQQLVCCPAAVHFHSLHEHAVRRHDCAPISERHSDRLWQRHDAQCARCRPAAPHEAARGAGVDQHVDARHSVQLPARHYRAVAVPGAAAQVSSQQPLAACAQRLLLVVSWVQRVVVRPLRQSPSPVPRASPPTHSGPPSAFWAAFTLLVFVAGGVGEEC